MIIYNIAQLEKRLIEKSMSDRDIFNYLLLWLIFATVATYPIDDGFSNSWLPWLDVTVHLAVMIIGIKATWDTNSNGDHADYFTRFISLAVVNGIRVAIKIIATGILLFILISLFLPENYLTGTKKDIFEMALGIIFQVVFYYRLNRSFVNVSRLKGYLAT